MLGFCDSKFYQYYWSRSGAGAGAAVDKIKTRSRSRSKNRAAPHPCIGELSALIKGQFSNSLTSEN